MKSQRRMTLAIAGLAARAPALHSETGMGAYRLHGGWTAWALMALLTGCGNAPGGTMPPNPGALLITFTPAPVSVANLQLSSASVQIEALSVFGDVAPNGQSMLRESQVDALDAPTTFTFAMVPQGLYSRVRFNASEIAIDGSWRGHPLHVAVDMDLGSLVDLRSSSGTEVQPGQDGTLPLDVNAGPWFDGNLLDQATVDATGAITLNALSNTSVASLLFARVAPSFSLAMPVQ
jgi:hypothetical protein